MITNIALRYFVRSVPASLQNQVKHQLDVDYLLRKGNKEHPSKVLIHMTTYVLTLAVTISP